MNTIIDYINWRGDLSFENSPFNEVDNLILSQLAYIDYSEVIPDKETNVMYLYEAAQKLLVNHPEGIVPCGLMKCEEMNDLLNLAGASERFSHIGLFFPQSCLDEENQEQFYAITFIIGDGSMYIGFRGTDQTIVGWQEDFNMAFISPVPSQLRAADYLSEVAKLRKEKIITGGHSKGGNLAIYSAAFANDFDKNRIISVYSNDGPGFPEEIVDTPEYSAIISKILLIIPQGSVVGMLLEHKGEYCIVKSTQKGILQHDGFTWEVMGNSFVKLNNRDKSSILVDITLSQWISSLSEEQRKIFVQSLFEVISMSGAQTLEELPGDAVKLLKGIRTLAPKTKEVLGRAVKELTEQTKRSAKQFLLENKNTAKSIKSN